MPKRTSIGVDVGSSAVRAAEVLIDGKNSHIQRFAQVGLPSGAVVEGEVRDEAAVASALKRLWSEGGFHSKDIVLGVSSQRAMVRVIEMPKIDGKELRSALRYEIGDLLPIPLEQAVFDFAVLGPGKPNGDGGETTQVLVVVAQKDIVWDEIRVAKRAGLRVRAVDASPLALLRAVPPPSGSEALDAVVSLGAQLVVVAVRQGETPRFLRTATVASEPASEPAARVASGSRIVPGSVRERSESRMGVGKSDPVVEEVRSSIEYFLSHAQGARLERVQLTGGGALVGGVAERVSASLGIPVVPASVIAKYDRSALGFDEVQFREASQRWTTAVGLALWGTDGSHAPTLLPPEIEEHKRQRRTTVMAAAGVVVMASGLGVLSVGRAHDTAAVKQKVTLYKAQEAVLEQDMAKMSSITKVQGEVEARRLLTQQALSTDIDWVSLDKRIEKALPPGVIITEINYNEVPAVVVPPVAGAAGVVTTTPSSLNVGTITMTAQAKGGLSSIAEFIDRESGVRGVGAVWVLSSTGGSSAAGAATAPTAPPSKSGLAPAGTAVNTVTTFEATAEVTNESLSNRGSKLPGGNQ